MKQKKTKQKKIRQRLHEKYPTSISDKSVQALKMDNKYLNKETNNKTQKHLFSVKRTLRQTFLYSRSRYLSVLAESRFYRKKNHKKTSTHETHKRSTMREKDSSLLSHDTAQNRCHNLHSYGYATRPVIVGGRYQSSFRHYFASQQHTVLRRVSRMSTCNRHCLPAVLFFT